MGIIKPILKGAIDVAQNKSVQKTVVNSIKSSDSAVIKTTAEILDFVPDFTKGLSEIPNFKNLTPKTQEVIINARKRFWEQAKKSDDYKTVYENINAYADHIIKYSDNEDYIVRTLANSKNFSYFVKTRNKMNDIFKHSISNSFEDKQKFFTNFSLMAMYNPENFKILSKTVGLDEIIKGKLSISTLKNIKSNEVFDPDFFYKYFDNLEKQTSSRILKTGINEESINTYIKLKDADICKNPQILEDLLTKLEKIKNPELVNMILKDFPINAENIEFADKHFLKLLDNITENPEIVEKVLKMKNVQSHFVLNNYISIFKNTEQCKITDDIFEYYLELEKKYPKNINCETLESFNRFLNFSGANSTELKSIINARPNDFNIIFNNIDENNISYLKNCLKKGSINDCDIFKLSATKNKPEYKGLTNLDEFDEDYKKFYAPTKENLDKITSLEINEKDYYMENLYSLYKDSPEKFNRLVDLNLFKFMEDGTISPRLLFYLRKNNDLIPQVYDDLILLNKGQKSAIKHFESTKDILKQTTVGDVVSVNGKLYINNNGKLEPWNMSEEKFNELFPLVDRYTTSQGKDDCYMISVINSIYQNPRTRGKYYKMFEQVGDDIQVTIPAYKDFGGPITFEKGITPLSSTGAAAAKHVKMIEQSYARTALRSGKNISTEKNPLTTDDTNFLQKRIGGGRQENVFREFFPEELQNGKFSQGNMSDKNNIKYFLENYTGNDRYIVTEAFKTGTNEGHAISITGFKPKEGLVTIVDPNRFGTQKDIPINEFEKEFMNFIFMRV